MPFLTDDKQTDKPRLVKQTLFNSSIPDPADVVYLDAKSDTRLERGSTCMQSTRIDKATEWLF
jgi:hypothetical protein